MSFPPFHNLLSNFIIPANLHFGDILPSTMLRLEVGASWDVPTTAGMITKLSPFVQWFYTQI